MGEEGRSSEIEYASNRVFDDFQRHSSHPRVSTEHSIVSTLREHYPGYSVTVTPKWTGIISFADAGQAEAKLDTTDGILWRTHEPAKGRSSKDMGRLKDIVHFGKYDYKWNNYIYIVYIAEWSQGFSIEQIVCILHRLEKDDVTSDRCLAADDLIAAASQYTNDPHDEMFVYDREIWTKNSDLWSSVQQSYWDDVILNSEMKEALIKDIEGFFDSENDYKEFAVPWKASLIHPHDRSFYPAF